MSIIVKAEPSHKVQVSVHVLPVTWQRFIVY